MAELTYRISLSMASSRVVCEIYIPAFLHEVRRNADLVGNRAQAIRAIRRAS
jgi:hypothetical protein